MSAPATPNPTEHPVVLRLEGVSKVYPGTVALKSVDFELRSGAVNVLVGENGAGKSTMMKIIAGVEPPSEGRILLDGKPVHLGSTEQARAHGIGIVFQELNLFPNMSIAENLFIGREITSRWGAIEKRAHREKAQALLRELEHDLDPDLLVGELRIGQQQIIEIAKAMAQNARILILDEPTSALSAPEVEILFRVINDLKSRGVAIVYISHRLEELIRIGDYITVLRDGRITGSSVMSAVDVPWIVKQMVGASTRNFARAEDHAFGDTVLEVAHVFLPRPGAPGYLVEDMSLTLRAGEIVGIYGLMGAGRTELFECIFGCRPEQARGSVKLLGKELIGNDVTTCINAGLALIPEDRKADGLVHSMSISENLTLANLWRMAKRWHLSPATEGAAAGQFIQSLSIKAKNPQLEIGSLSGGNQQKVVIGRALMTDPKVLLMDEPSRGIDIGAKADVFKVMRDLAKSGLGILFVTSDLEEVMALSDRIVVMSNGRLAAQFGMGEATEDAVVLASNSGQLLAA
jgi:erythritol transport system ATP-binding protein